MIAPLWTYAFDIATYVLAVVAVAGFFYSLRSSRQTALTAERIQRALDAMVEPVIKVSGYEWRFAKDGDVSPGNPPVAIVVRLSNMSNVPIQLYRTDLKTFFGEMPLTEMVQNIQVTEKASIILVRGEPLNITQVQPNEYPKYLGKARSDPYFGPQFTIQLEAEFGTIGGGRRRLYKTRQVIYFDIAQPTVVNGRRATEETVSDLPGDKASPTR